jgi:hypothetical protein
MGIITHLCRRLERTSYLSDDAESFALSLLVERVTTRAATCGVWVIDRETLFLNRVLEINGGTVKIRHTHLVYDYLDAIAKLTNGIAIEHSLVKVELVDESRAATGLHCETEAKVIATLLSHEATHFRCCRIR